MNPNYERTGASLNNFDFDLGIGSNRSRSLNDQKNKPNSYGSSYSSASSYSQSGARPGMVTTGAPSWQPNKPSWTHQPAPASSTMGMGTRSEIGGPTSMVGDIFGNSWSSVTQAKTGPSVGIVSKDPGLFKDLVSSALNQNKSNGNAPLKSSGPASSAGKSSFSMGSMADSLPTAKGTNGVNKATDSGNAMGGGSSWGSSEKFGSFVGASNTSSTYGYGTYGMNKGMNSGNAMGGGAIGGGGSGLGTSSNKDPFGSLFDLGSKPSGGAGLNSTGIAKPTSSEGYGFGDFQNASMSGASRAPPSAFSYSNNTSMGSNKTQPQQHSGSDSFDMFFTPSSGSSVGVKATPEQSGNQESSGGDDWGFSSDFGGGNDVGSTTELDGLPPPPAGVSASSAKSKGLDNYKQGQYADAIKWLSWAIVLLEKTGDDNSTTEVLTCRASCYKEVGEYKKAVADCTTVLGNNGENIAVLVQRALLYESMEKYKLGAEDLRTVMKLDPANRVARSTIHRLTKMID